MNKKEKLQKLRQEVSKISSEITPEQTRDLFFAVSEGLTELVTDHRRKLAEAIGECIESGVPDDDILLAMSPRVFVTAERADELRLADRLMELSDAVSRARVRGMRDEDLADIYEHFILGKNIGGSAYSELIEMMAELHSDGVSDSAISRVIFS